MAAKRILLIEDEREVANMLTLALRSSDYEVEYAHTAEQARACLSSGRYDLVITDWRLPDGNGLDIADIAADNGTKTMIVQRLSNPNAGRTSAAARSLDEANARP